jgi:hypothetical protein
MRVECLSNNGYVLAGTYVINVRLGLNYVGRLRNPDDDGGWALRQDGIVARWMTVAWRYVEASYCGRFKIMKAKILVAVVIGLMFAGGGGQRAGAQGFNVIDIAHKVGCFAGYTGRVIIKGCDSRLGASTGTDQASSPASVNQGASTSPTADERGYGEIAILVLAAALFAGAVFFAGRALIRWGRRRRLLSKAFDLGDLDIVDALT